MAFGLEEFAERVPDAAAIHSHASAIHKIINQTDAAMEGIEQTWSRLSQPGVYSVPGDEVVFSALKPARTATSDLAETATELSEAMASYADEIDSLKARYSDLKARTDSFDAEHSVAEKDEWNDDDDAVAEYNLLASESAGLMADLDQAQRNAANRIAGIAGNSRRYSESGTGEEVAYGRPSDDRLADEGGHMGDGDIWLVDVWESAFVNTGKKFWETVDKIRDRYWEAGDEVRQEMWDRAKRGFITVPGIPLPGFLAPPDRSNPSGLGRDPNQQPVIGDNDYGDGTWQNVKRQEPGGAYQEYVTGIQRREPGHALEYVVPSDGAFYGEVEFDGHFWRPGPPPEEVFQEAKGRYEFMDNWLADEDKKANRDPLRTKLDYVIQETWINGQMQHQLDALEGNPFAKLEWYVAEESVRKELQRQVDLDEELRGRVKIIVERHP